MCYSDDKFHINFQNFEFSKFLFSMPQATVRTFDDEDFEDIQLLLKKNVFDWKDLLSKEEYEVASMKKYFSEIAKNNAW